MPMNDEQLPSENISVSEQGDILVIHPEGEIRVRGVISLRAMFEHLADNPEHDRIAVDLGKVTFIDSSGLGLLTNFAKRLMAKDTKLYLVGANDELKDLLEMAGIDQIIPLAQRIEQIASTPER